MKMSNLKEKTKKALDDLAAFLMDSPWRDAYLMQVHQLAARLETPCVLAVAGEVKAGKSSFINAFLKDDLALVGVTETTATINYFRYGEVPDKTKPVRCVWLDGRETWESQAFLDSLQGNTQEVLERAVGIKHLEFYISNPRLKSIQLVDTPGTGAHIGEDGAGHEEQTRGYFNMQKGLRDRHNAETQTISRDADAVIYIMTGHAANEENVKFLQEFIGNGGVNSHNSVGIMAKVDTNDTLLGNLDKYVDHMAEIVNGKLPVPIPILPVSSGIQRVLDIKGIDWLKSLRSRLLEGFESPELLLRALGDAERFDRETCRGSTLSRTERMEMHKGMPWRCFVVIARTVVGDDFDKGVDELRKIAGFDAVNQVLEEQFFQRGIILRCHSVIQDCCRLLWELENGGLYRYKEGIAQQTDEICKFIDFIMEHPKYTERGIGGEMRRFFDRKMERDRSSEFKTKLLSLRTAFENLLHGEISSVSANFEGLRLLEKYPDCVTDAEREELTSLFRDVKDVTEYDCTKLAKRQVFWRVALQSARLPERKELAVVAERQYGVLISNVKGSET